MDCLFCKIIENEVPSKKIYENNDVLVFMDLNQDYPGHLLIIPKNHFLDIEDVSSDILIEIFKVIKIMNSKLKNRLNTDGLTIIENNGIAQEIKHLHFHLIPKYRNIPKLSIDEIFQLLK